MTDTYKALLGAPEPQDTILEGVRLTHSEFTQDYFLGKSNTSFTGNIDSVDETFEPHGFEFVRPMQSESGTEPMKFTMDATDRVIFDEIELAANDRQEPIILTWWAFIQGNTTPQTDEISFELLDITYAGSVVSSEARLTMQNKQFSTQLYTTTRFPGLVYT